MGRCVRKVGDFIVGCLMIKRLVAGNRKWQHCLSTGSVRQALRRYVPLGLSFRAKLIRLW